MVLAGISHDVRTPLTKLRLALSMMHAEDRALMDAAERQIDAMERILSQFLTFARGFAAEPPAAISVRDLLDAFDARYGAEGVVVAPPDADATLQGRPEALRRALANLVDNALRYGAAPVGLEADVRDDRIRFVVSDAGEGIAPDEVDRLRQPFVRGDAARSADGTGTGLGLAIVDEIARLHGGEVVYARADGRFRATLDLPLAGA
nr:ATP-binding protein [Oharaeibacter diazotrophicus]